MGFVLHLVPQRGRTLASFDEAAHRLCLGEGYWHAARVSWARSSVLRCLLLRGPHVGLVLVGGLKEVSMSSLEKKVCKSHLSECHLLDL